MWSHYCWGHISQQSPTCPRQVCVTNSLVLLLSPTQCKVSFRSYLQVIISRVVSSIWRITDWPDLSIIDTFRAWPRISSSLLLEWPWDIVITLTRGGQFLLHSFPSASHSHHNPKYAHLTPFTKVVVTQIKVNLKLCHLRRIVFSQKNRLIRIL